MRSPPDSGRLEVVYVRVHQRPHGIEAERSGEGLGYREGAERRAGTVTLILGFTTSMDDPGRKHHSSKGPGHPEGYPSPADTYAPGRLRRYSVVDRIRVLRSSHTRSSRKFVKERLPQVVMTLT